MTLEELLNIRNIKKSELARAVGVSPGLVTRWTTVTEGVAQRKPGWRKLSVLANVLNMDVESTMRLFNGNSPQ